MGIDEAGRDDPATGIEAPVRWRGRQVADGGDALATDADVGAAARPAQPVDHPAAFDDQIQFFLHATSALMGPAMTPAACAARPWTALVLDEAPSIVRPINLEKLFLLIHLS